MVTTSKLDYVSIGCNCIGESAVWGKNGLCAYAAHHFIALMSPEQSEILATLRGHKDRVNHVQWIPNVYKDDKGNFIEKESELVSVSTDSTIIIWKQKDIKDDTSFEVISTLKSHTDSVNSCSVLRLQDGSLLLCSASSDNTVKLWRRGAPVYKEGEQPTVGEFELIQSIEFKPKMMTCSSMALIPGTNTPILALGGVESKIHLFIQDYFNNELNNNNNTPLFRKVVALQGHQDWIRCLKFRDRLDEKGNLLLASSSQDYKIRLWKISLKEQSSTETENNNNNDVMGSLSATLSGVTSLSTKAHIFNIRQTSNDSSSNDGKETIRAVVNLESVLSGHEDWVYTVSWHPSELCLVSASMDKTMMIWRPDRHTGVWVDELRVGDMGGNILGLYGGLFSPCGQYLLSHGYNGAFHLYRREDSSNTGGEQEVRVISTLVPQIIVSGHFGPVQDLMWAPDGNYLASLSSDRTIRLFAEWKRETHPISWNEIARPQIHGYDLECFTFVHGKTHVIVSGAEEKILRVFIGSKNFVDSLSNIANVSYSGDTQRRPVAANQPSLGLSNKPFFDNQDGDDQGDQNEINAMTMGEDNEALGEGGYEEPVPFNPEVLDQPPFEEHLLQSSLWPEIQKLYGHGNEIISVACSYDGKYVASACRASSADQATIRIWDVDTWKEVANLKGHTLTIIQLAFSHDNKYLLGVSRDRMWSLWRRTDDPLNPYVRASALPKAHGRIIWGCSWTWDDQIFATGSRDKDIKLWQNVSTTAGGDDWKLLLTLPLFSSAVTATEFSPKLPEPYNNLYLLAVGEENGNVSIWRGDKNNKSDWKLLYTIPSKISHIQEVRRIRWRDRPVLLSNNQLEYQIATCSNDQSVRIFTIQFDFTSN